MLRLLCLLTVLSLGCSQGSGPDDLDRACRKYRAGAVINWDEPGAPGNTNATGHGFLSDDRRWVATGAATTNTYSGYYHDVRNLIAKEMEKGVER